MKKQKIFIISALVFFIAIFALNPEAYAIFVQGYLRDGDYIMPHFRSAPDSTPLNNYGYPGNSNPFRYEFIPTYKTFP